MGPAIYRPQDLRLISLKFFVAAAGRRVILRSKPAIDLTHRGGLAGSTIAKLDPAALEGTQLPVCSPNAFVAHA